jgi:hypothetical protein
MGRHFRGFLFILCHEITLFILIVKATSLKYEL